MYIEYSGRLNQLRKIIETEFIGNPGYLFAFSALINVLIEIAEVDEDDNFILIFLDCVLKINKI